MHSIHSAIPFNVRPVVRSHQTKGSGEEMRATHRTAACNYLYIMRENGTDEHGATPNWAARKDLIDSGRIAPLRGGMLELSGIRLWEQADRQSRETRPSVATAIHIVCSLPPELGLEEWKEMVLGFGETWLMRKGMIADWAIHAQSKDSGEWLIHPHVHLLATARGWDPTRAPGVRRHTWLGSKAQINTAGNAWYEISGMRPKGSYVFDGVAA